MTFYDELKCTTIYDVLCQWNKEMEIVIKCRKLSSTPLCAQCHSALKPASSLCATHATHSLILPGRGRQAHGSVQKIGRADLCEHSAWACQAARSSVHDMGPHSPELAILLEEENGTPCRTRSCTRWLMILLKMACAPGAVLPYCSSTTGVIPFSTAWRLMPVQCRTGPNRRMQFTCRTRHR